MDWACRPVIDLQALFTSHVLLRSADARGSFVAVMEHFFFRDEIRIHATAEMDATFHEAFDIERTAEEVDANAIRELRVTCGQPDWIRHCLSGRLAGIMRIHPTLGDHLSYLAGTAVVGLLCYRPLASMDLSWRRVRRLLSACPGVWWYRHRDLYRCTSTTAPFPDSPTAFQCVGFTEDEGYG